MERRNCCEVLSQMIDKIPIHKVDFIKALKWNLDDASFKAPEDNIQWIRTQKTLLKHIVRMEEDWEFEVISVFTTKTVKELKNKSK